MKMKATGIVRRIDDLGRVVIPKEVRRSMRIKEGDPLEIFVNAQDCTVSFRKYQPFEELDWVKAKAIVSAMYPDLQFGLYNDYGEKQTATNVTLPRTIEIDDFYDEEQSIITSEMDTIGYIVFDSDCLKADCEKIRAVLRQFFSTNF